MRRATVQAHRGDAAAASTREPFAASSDSPGEPLEADVRENGSPAFRGLEDELLVVRCHLGERPAFDELIQRWHEPLWRYVRRLADDEDTANDITQDVWLRVLRGIGRLRDGAKLRPWLFGVARRALMDRLRGRYAAPLVADVDLSTIAAEDASDDREEELRAMEEEMDRLPVVERETLTLFYLRELSLAEVASVLEVPVGTVKSRLFRARRMLRNELETRGRNS